MYCACANAVMVHCDCVLEKDASASPAGHAQEWSIEFFLAPPGRALILDPGVSLSLWISAQSRGRVLPDPGIFLSLLKFQELSGSLYDLSKCFMLSVCLLGFLKIILRFFLHKVVTELIIQLWILGHKKTTTDIHCTRYQ